MDIIRCAVLLAAAVITLSEVYQTARAADGDLDPTFGTGGMKQITIGVDQIDLANAVAVQPDGKIVMGGEVGSYPTPTVANRSVLVRLNPDGSLDQSFGTGGIVINPGQIHLSALIIQPDGKIITSGATRVSGITTDFAVVRYNANGTLDQTFGSGGYAINGDGEAQTLLLQPDGKIALVGFITLFRNGSDFLLTRFNPDGSVDTNFGSAGRVQTSFTSGRNSDDHAYAAALQPDGKIVATGAISGVPTVLIRYNSNGSVDTSFGLDGSVLTPNSGTTARNAVLQPDGKIVIGGNAFALRRYNANGTTDQGFTLSSNTFGGSYSHLQDIHLQSDGKILAAGGVCYTNTGECNFLLARYNPNGGLDPTFGTSGGFVITNVTEGTLDEAFALTLQTDGKIILAGYASEPGGSYVDFAVARYLNTTPPTTAPRRTQFDFDGDSRADVSVFREGTWHLNRSTDGYLAFQFGLETDKIVPADYDGDGKTDIAVFRPSEGNWYWLNSGSGTYSIVHFGQDGDIPVVADYDGDGHADYAVFRQGVWYIQRSTEGLLVTQFGLSADKPVASDYDGDGKTDIAVFRDGTWYIQKSSGGNLITQFGLSGDMPVVCDYDGDGKADIAVWRPGDGVWHYLKSSDGGYNSYQFGMSSDIPVAADYDGDGRADLAIYRGGQWWIWQSRTNNYSVLQFGNTGDKPVPSAYIQ